MPGAYSILDTFEAKQLIYDRLNNSHSIWVYHSLGIGENFTCVYLNGVKNCMYEDLTPFPNIEAAPLYLPFIHKGVKIIVSEKKNDKWI